MTSTEIIERFKKGEREFSEIKAVGQDFSRMTLSKTVFTNSRFIGCRFTASDLRNARFQDCSFEFCEFTDANLVESNFINCKMDYTVFQLANLERTVFTNCELYFIYVWGSNFNSAAKFVKTQMAKVFNAVSEVSEEDIKKIFNALASSEVPLGLKMEAKGRAMAGIEKYESLLKFAYGKGAKSKGVYETPSTYFKTQGEYGQKNGYLGENPFYTLLTAYLAKQQYGKKK